MHKHVRKLLNSDAVCTRLEVKYAVGSENGRGCAEPLGFLVQPPARSRATSVSVLSNFESLYCFSFLSFVKMCQFSLSLCLRLLVTCKHVPEELT